MEHQAAVDYFRKHSDVVLVLSAIAPKLPNTRIPDRQMKRFFGSNEPLLDLKAMLREPNLFRALGITEKEIRHSRVLAWLFNPLGSHGQGTIYLERLFRLVFRGSKALPKACRLNLRDFTVLCESDSIDILLVNQKTRVVCAIENKINAAQGDNQLSRYRDKIEAQYAAFELRLLRFLGR